MIPQQMLTPSSPSEPRESGNTWMPEGWEVLPVGEYAFPGPLRDRLVTAVLTGAKRTTTALLAEYEACHEPLPTPGRRELVVDSSGVPVCVTEDVAVDVVRMADVSPEHAAGEGEGYTTVAQWRAGHEAFWCSANQRDWFASLDVEPPRIDDDTLVVCTRFDVVARRPGAVDAPRTSGASGESQARSAYGAAPGCTNS